jgi:hypothetical protein
LVAIEQVGRGRLENVQVKKRRRGSEMWGALHTYVWASGAGLRHVTNGHPRGSPALFRQASLNLSPRLCDDGSQLLIHVEDSQFAPYYAASLV